MEENTMIDVVEEVTESTTSNSGLKTAGMVGLCLLGLGGLAWVGKKVYTAIKAKRAAEADVVAECDVVDVEYED